jgi:glucose/arabinose dehydrogenase
MTSARLPVGSALATLVGFSALAALAALIALALTPGCGQRRGPSDPPPVVALSATFGGLTFPHATGVLQHPADDHRWYVLEQGGTVETLLDTDPAGTRAVAVTVPGVLSSGENGLLGMAFHPDFTNNGEVILSYVVDTGGAAGTSTITRYVSGDGGLTFAPDPGPQADVLTLVQPFENHNGGEVLFGPDGYLYVAFGDGGGAGDPSGHGQDLNTLFGKILRLDVDSARPYAIPPDNPFVGVAGLDEIFAYGFRNPWRMSFDPATGALWVGDVGQDRVEEVDVVGPGENFGWNVMEGDRLYPSGTPAEPPGLVPPVAVHDHPRAESVTGGYVYHGASIAALTDHYVYGDFITGRLFSIDATVLDPVPQEIAHVGLHISSFGQGRDGELLVVGYGAASAIYRIDPLP